MSNLLDSIYYNVGNFIYLGVQWLISIVLVRMGGFEDAGYFSLAMTYGNIFCMLANYGLRSFQVSDIKNEFKDSTYIISRVLTIAISAILCLGFTSLFMGYSLNLNLLILCYIFYKLSESYADVITGIWQKAGNMLFIGISYTLKGISSLCSFLVAYHFTKNLLLSTFLMAVTHFVVLTAFDFSVTKKYTNHFKSYHCFDKNELTGLLKLGFMTMSFNVFTALFNSIPRLVVEKRLSAEMLGIFSSLYNPTVIISTFAVGVLLPFAPKMAMYYQQGNKKPLAKMLFLCNGIIALMGIFGAGSTYLIGKPVFSLVYGKEILEYLNLFYILIAASVLLGMSYSYSYLLIAIRKFKPLLLFSALSCISVLGLSLYLIPEQNISGGAYASLGAIALQFITETVYICILVNKLNN